MTIVEQYKVFKLELAGTAAGNPYVEVELSARMARTALRSMASTRAMAATESTLCPRVPVSGTTR